MKVSKKTYRDKQNHATGALVVAGIALLMVLFKSYQILVADKDADWDLALWIIMVPVLLITWRIRENKLNQLEVE